MKVYKFGGASLKDAESVKNVTSIIKNCQSEMVVVVSAMGKTTNKLELLTEAYYYAKEEWRPLFEDVKQFHIDIANDLSLSEEAFGKVVKMFNDLEERLEVDRSMQYDFDYDQIVCYGELLSSVIVCEYLIQEGLGVKWLDIRKLLKTDNTYREAAVDWTVSAGLFKKHVDFSANKIFVTQGFIGSTSTNATTTLGREGSDFSAACVAYCLDASDVTIWKDVPGVLNADPRWFQNTVKLNNISYHEAVELAYYGASVIHPKTIKPLRSKAIPLYVNSFLQPGEGGTVINDNTSADSLIPSYIVKHNQMLISISPRDYSFIDVENLNEIFSLFAKYHMKINMMQNSAISFSVSVENNSMKLPSLIAELKDNYKILYNEDLELITIRHYDANAMEQVLANKKLFIEQRSRQTARFVVKATS